MKYKPLPSQKRLQELFDYDKKTGNLIWRISPRKSVKVGAIAGTLTSKGYTQVKVDNTVYYAHRLIWVLLTGNDPGEFTIDHKDRNRRNNRIDNLRLATQKEQMANTGQRGYSFNKRSQLWHASIRIDRTNVNLGSFPTESLARLAYETYAQKIFGEFTESRLENPFGFTNTIIKPWTKYYSNVYLDKRCNKYMARITIDGKTKHLGYFTDREEARLAVRAAKQATNKSNP